MNRTHRLRLPVAALILLAGCAAAAQELPGDATRGRLLYENHCQGCHTSRAHVRENRKANSYAEVRGWVTRWQGSESLNWNGRDIRDVATWLFLRFYDPDWPTAGGSGSS